MNIKIFEQTKQINEYQQEFWKARELGKILEYSEYRHFKPVVEKAKMACINSGYDPDEHFEDVLDMVPIGSGAQREIDDIKLSRYACYLIVQNADPSKEVVALGQTYFAIQTRKQEIADQHLEDQRRVYLREQVAEHNKLLAQTAKEIGVTNYANFVDYGYLGLYGMRNKDILKTKGLDLKSSLMDHVGSEELAANLFRATQAESKIKREGIHGQQQAQQTHLEVGKKVRDTIKKIGGTMPEKLSSVDHIKEAKKRIKGVVKNLSK